MTYTLESLGAAPVTAVGAGTVLPPGAAALTQPVSLAGGEVKRFQFTVPPGVGRKAALSHEGEEFLLVVDGPVGFEYDGELHELETGDATYFAVGTNAESEAKALDRTIEDLARRVI